jgi:hypothetical protein
MKHIPHYLLITFVLVAGCTSSIEPNRVLSRNARAFCAASEFLEKDFGSFTCIVDPNLARIIKKTCPGISNSVVARPSTGKLYEGKGYDVSFNVAERVGDTLSLTVHFFRSPEAAYAVLVRFRRSADEWLVISTELLSVS